MASRAATPKWLQISGLHRVRQNFHFEALMLALTLFSYSVFLSVILRACERFDSAPLLSFRAQPRNLREAIQYSMRAIAAISLNRDTAAFSRFKQIFALINISATLRPRAQSALRVNSDSSAALGMTN